MTYRLPGGFLSRVVSLSVLMMAGAAAQNLVVFPEAGKTTYDQLTLRLNAIGQEHLRQRRGQLAQVRTVQDAQARQKLVREKILRLLGGLPEYRGPLNTRKVGTVEHEDYRYEKIIYESLPGFYVPANVYVPVKGNGPFPAVLMPVGHNRTEGKAGERLTAIGLVRLGFVVLKYDPLGQGERWQYYDPDLRWTKLEGSVVEHSHANGQMMLVGDSVARYRIWDGMRGIDYLLTRRDVDPKRIGCTGCSGGGTVTTYISALDERVKAAAPACYISSWEEQLENPGPMDGEQSIAGFLSEGLNFADYVELFAPKPYLIASTLNDSFPVEGARQTYEEAKKFYGLFGAANRLEWFIGPGRHGVPVQSREAIYGFFLRYLGNGDGEVREAPVRLDPPEATLCTETGQVADSLGGETVFTINRKRARGMMPSKTKITRTDGVERLRTRLAENIRAFAAVSLQAGGPPPEVRVHSSVARSDYRMDLISYEVDRGVTVPGLLLIPNRAGSKPAVVVVDAQSKRAQAAPGTDLDTLARAGYVVLTIQPRGVPEIPPAQLVDPVNGDYPIAFRALMNGMTLAGMRVEDTIRAVDYVVSREDVDRNRITGLGVGQCGVYLLHAAVLDARIGRLVLESTLALYRLAVDRPIHRYLYEVAIPRVLTKYDLDDLLVAVSPRPVTVINPVDALGRAMGTAEFKQLSSYVFDTDSRLGQSNRVNVMYRTQRGKYDGELAGDLLPVISGTSK